MFSISSSDGTFIDISTWDSILVYLIAQKLDIQTRKEWEQSLKASTSIPPMSEMLNFLETTFRTLESLEEDKATTIPLVYAKDPRKKPTKIMRSHTATTLNDNNCLCCNKRHPLYKCFRFTTLSSPDKKNFVNQHRLC